MLMLSERLKSGDEESELIDQAVYRPGFTPMFSRTRFRLNLQYPGLKQLCKQANSTECWNFEQ